MKCPQCKNGALSMGWCRKNVWIDSKEYPADVMMEWCDSCGYEKPRTCNIEPAHGDKKEASSKAPDDPQSVPVRNKSIRKYDVISFIRSRGSSGLATDEYIEQLRENDSMGKLSKSRYDLLVGARRKNIYAQNSRVPKCRTIIDDSLIDTDSSELVISFSQEINPKTGDMIRHFYYLSDEGMFFRIILRPNGKQDAPRKMTIDEMKKILLREDPEMYIRYFPVAVKPGNEIDDSLGPYACDSMQEEGSADGTGMSKGEQPDLGDTVRDESGIDGREPQISNEEAWRAYTKKEGMNGPEAWDFDVIAGQAEQMPEKTNPEENTIPEMSR